MIATFENRDAFLVALGAAIFEANQLPSVTVHLDTDPQPDDGMLAIWIEVPHDADDPDVGLKELRAVDAAYVDWDGRPTIKVARQPCHDHLAATDCGRCFTAGARPLCDGGIGRCNTATLGHPRTNRTRRTR